MGGKLSIAKKFAQRRAIYRTKAVKACDAAFNSSNAAVESEMLERSDRFQMAAEAIEHMWADIRDEL